MAWLALALALVELPTSWLTVQNESGENTSGQGGVKLLGITFKLNYTKAENQNASIHLIGYSADKDVIFIIELY